MVSGLAVLQVFEKLGLSLYDFLRVNQYRPFKINVVRDFGRQLLESVAYLHSLQLIHTDLKPENILLAAIDDERKSPTPGVRLALPPLILRCTFCCNTMFNVSGLDCTRLWHAQWHLWGGPCVHQLYISCDYS